MAWTAGGRGEPLDLRWLRQKTVPTHQWVSAQERAVPYGAPPFLLVAP